MPADFKRWGGSGLLLCALCVAIAPATGAINVSDATGQQVSLPAPAQRVISLAPHVTELLFAAGAGERVVGAVDYSDYPEAASSLPRVGGASGLDLERIVALKPDLIVGWSSGNPARLIERLRALGFPVYLSEPRRLADVARDMEQLGALAGTTATAHAASARFTVEYRALAERYAHREPVRVFYQVLDPLVITVNDHHMISEVGRLCGGVNVFAGVPKLDPVVGEEAVLEANPEAIVASGTEQVWKDWEPRWRAWPQLLAARRGALYFIPADLLHRQSPRILAGARQLCAALDDARRRR